MRVIGLSAALILAAAMVPTAQPSPQSQAPPPQGPTFRVEVSYVELDAVVTDAEGKFVRGLAKDDFEILEDGKPQSVTAFSLVDLPIRRADAATVRATPVEPDVRSNEGDFNGRVIVLVLDDLLVDAKRTQAVRASAKQFISRFVSENDLGGRPQHQWLNGGLAELHQQPRIVDCRGQQVYREPTDICCKDEDGGPSERWHGRR